ncbi:YCF48-related protein [Taibaiella chishuiensis]|uniref:Putative secreted protein (Por secretion system target) n=1 Tax=Taibaiella chishuiensis TaxID=1434707 RepID=A0A2P8D8A3_9BACT|nr:YCF48-related protein [Taibaiella chishuiensis]PSK93454.1 putative secreted protein (Por secretion system target) [Taibaiella chishuiensis]
MKKTKIALLAIGFLLPFSLMAQWTKLSSPTTKDLNAVCFVSGQTGWAAGKDGIVIKTTNGGAAWAVQNAGASKDLNTVFFVSEQTGWVGGKNGIIRKTNDGGGTWTAQATGTSKKINSIHFFDANNGIAVGEENLVLKTANGGAVWSRTAGRPTDSDDDDDDDKDGHSLNKVQMLSAQKAFVCGDDGYFAVSNNGGSSWTVQPAGTTADLEGMHFVTEQSGYVCYKSGGVRKTNGTGSFTAVTAATSKDLNALYFITAEKGWAVGDDGRIQHTTNGGNSWVSQNVSGVTAELKALHFPAATAGYAVGKNGTILKSNGNSNGTTAISELETLNGIAFYPNPVNERLIISLSAAALTPGVAVQVIVADVYGRTVASVACKASGKDLVIPAQHWAAGAYFVKVIAGDRIANGKIIKP